MSLTDNELNHLLSAEAQIQSASAGPSDVEPRTRTVAENPSPPETAVSGNYGWFRWSFDAPL